MRILLSAFDCHPDYGSEAGVGWAWAWQLATAGHEVCVLTRSHNKGGIQAFLSRFPKPGLRFFYVDVHRIPLMTPCLGVYPHYYAWQLKVFRLIRRRREISSFDCVHHITTGTYRTPFFLALLDIPSIFGPVGGGETTSARLTAGMSLQGRIRELLRVPSVFLGNLNPLTRMTWRRSTLILVTTEQTLKAIPKRYRSKARVMLAVTNPPSGDGQEVDTHKPRCGGFRALFVARMLDWKGPHLAIDAVSIARQSLPGLTLTIVGNGPSESGIRKLVTERRLDDHVRWHATISRKELLNLYESHDVLLFMNLRDAGGTVVLEALSRGVPVIYLKLGAFGPLLDPACGACVDPNGKSTKTLATAIAQEMVRLSALSSIEKQTMRQAALKATSGFCVSSAVEQTYAWLEEAIGQPSGRQTNSATRGGESCRKH